MIGRIYDFWFERKSTEALELFRIALGCFACLILLISFPNWERFYGEWGMAPLLVYRDWEGAKWSLFTLFDSKFYLWGLYILFLLCSLTLALGFFTRLSTVVLFIGYSSMIHRNTWLVNGQDQVLQLLLFFSCFAPLGSSYSLDALRLKRRGAVDSILHEVWGLRLLQLSFALIYLSTGISKWSTWKEGDAFYFTSFTEAWFRFPAVEWLHNPNLSFVLSYGTMLIEVSFAILIWSKKLRLPLLILMGVFHLVLIILLSSSVLYFNLAMFVGLLLFLDNEHAKALLSRVAR